MNEPHWTEDATDLELVEAMCEIEEGLTEWEVDRAEEWYHRVVDEGRPLTPGQRRSAQQILREKG